MQALVESVPIAEGIWTIGTEIASLLALLRQHRVRENDGRKLDHQTLEAMALRAVDAVEQGVASGGCRGDVGCGPGHGVWLAGELPRGGKDASRARPVPGRPPKLSGAQMRRLYALIAGADPRCGPGTWSAS
jgi:hypothetical protein